MAWYSRRLGLVRLHMVAGGQRRNNLKMALIIRERQRLQEERRVRQYWVRPWIERRRLFGQFCTLFQELERESHGDYQAHMYEWTQTHLLSCNWGCQVTANWLICDECLRQVTILWSQGSCQYTTLWTLCEDFTTAFNLFQSRQMTSCWLLWLHWVFVIIDNFVTAEKLL